MSVHIHDSEFVPTLLAHLPRLPDAATTIFGKLDWIAYLTQLVTSANGAPQPQLAPLLQLVSEINIVQPAALSSALRLALMGESHDVGALTPQLQALHAQVWALADGAALAAAFDGSTLLAPLLRGDAKEEPSVRRRRQEPPAPLRAPLCAPPPPTAHRHARGALHVRCRLGSRRTQRCCTRWRRARRTRPPLRRRCLRRAPSSSSR